MRYELTEDEAAVVDALRKSKEERYWAGYSSAINQLDPIMMWTSQTTKPIMAKPILDKWIIAQFRKVVSRIPEQYASPQPPTRFYEDQHKQATGETV